MLIISRKDAKDAELKRYFTGKPCKHGHVAEHTVGDGKCVACGASWRAENRDYAKSYYQENQAKILAQSAEHYQANREKIIARVKRRYANDPAHATRHIEAWQKRNAEQWQAGRKAYRRVNSERFTAKAAEWAKENPDQARANKKRYWQKNKPKWVADTAIRRAEQIRATPPWVSRKDIEPYYRDAERLSIQTGIPHEVDHIVPLRSGWVCGLHVHWNLQVVSRDVNRTKGNRHWPHMGALAGIASQRRGRVVAG